MKQIILSEYHEANCVGQLYDAATSTAKGSLLITCAMGITQKYYQHLALFFAQQGFQVLTFDYRGTGLSSPENLKGYTADLFDWGKDINDAIGYLNATTNTPLYYLGHSLI